MLAFENRTKVQAVWLYDRRMLPGGRALRLWLCLLAPQLVRLESLIFRQWERMALHSDRSRTEV